MDGFPKYNSEATLQLYEFEKATTEEDVCKGVERVKEKQDRWSAIHLLQNYAVHPT